MRTLFKYFSVTSDEFNHRTFTIYAEMGASDIIVQDILQKLDSTIEQLASDDTTNSVLLDITISPVLLERQDRLRAIQSRLQKAEDDVRNDRDQSKEKQRFLDASDRIREDTAARVSAAGHFDAGISENAVTVWEIAVSLLGSGAERLEAATKRDLVSKIVKLSRLIVDRWTRVQKNIDFAAIKSDLLKSDRIVSDIAKSGSDTDLEDAKRIVRNLVDLMEYVVLIQPFATVVAYLCEEARDEVLAQSIINTNVDGNVEELLRSLWLSDINVPKGKSVLLRSIKGLPKSKFWRSAISGHLMTRVYWKQWRKEDRLSLLNIANESLKGAGIQYKTAELQRIIEKLPETKRQLED